MGSMKKLQDYLTVGYVLRPRGVKGEVKVEPLTDSIEQFNEWDVLYIKDGDQYYPLKIITKRYIRNSVYISFEGYNNMNMAEKLRGQYLWIPRDQIGDLPEDTFFIADILGCEVRTQEGVTLGKVERVIHTGSNDVYLVKGSTGEVLIPGLKKVILDIDIIEKEIIVAAQELEGLLPDED
jgi:16S rRNA processing protein RimM